MNIIIDKKYNWQHAGNEDLKYWYIGSDKAVNRFISFCRGNPNASTKELKRELYNNRGNYAVIVEQKNRLIVTVDKIRSYPLFYLHEGNRFAVSNSARALKDECGLSEIDELSLLEFRMAGYVTGKETLYRDLYQLQAGEFLIWDKKRLSIERERYYLFYLETFRQEKEEDLIEELDEVTNRIFSSVIEEANGAPIWVPLSGGLDSRLVLCKLAQLGYENLTAFSYGARGNYESKTAREVAQRVGIHWHFVPIRMKEARKFFYSPLRKRYWTFSDGLSTLPNMQDIHPLKKLLEAGNLPSEAIIVNGQAGDFITGGHIPASFMNEAPRLDLFFQRALDKHYSQRLDLKEEKNVIRIIAKISSLIGVEKDEMVDRSRLTGLYEWWEWQERQCKYVVNGQRIYDFLGLRWFLPLWDDDCLRFWTHIPLELKFGQKLYKDYLDRFDFYGCFHKFHPVIWRWPGVSILVVPAARLIRLCFGRKYSDLFYQYFKYVGHYRQAYAPYRVINYVRKAKRIRGSIALDIETWLRENITGEGN